MKSAEIQKLLDLPTDERMESWPRSSGRVSNLRMRPVFSIPDWQRRILDERFANIEAQSQRRANLGRGQGRALARIMRLVLRSEAKGDLRDAFNWYEERQPGVLGRPFRAVVESILASIREHPFMYPKIDPSIRRAATSRFPFGIFYRVDGETFGSSR